MAAGKFRLFYWNRRTWVFLIPESGGVRILPQMKTTLTANVSSHQRAPL